MAIQPGSLDYLYYNGIIDHIPYEAYEMTPMTPSGRAQMMGMGTGYGQSLLNGYATPDMFVRNNNSYGVVNNNLNYRQEIMKSADLIGDGKMTKSDWVKGILAAGTVVLAGIGLVKGTGALCSKIKNAAFWAKLNPKNWFKK